MLFHKHKTAVVVLLLCSFPLCATTVVVIKTPHGMVMATDSQATKTSSDFLDLGQGVTKKFVIVQNRLAVATIGHEEIINHYPGIPDYHFFAWMEQLNASLPNDATAEQPANLIYAESSKLLISFDPALKEGIFKRQNPDDFCDPFIQYVIIGYQSGMPRLYEVQSYTDWDDKRLTNRPPISRDLGNDRDTHFYVFGFYQTATEVLNRNSYAYQQAMARLPQTFRKLLAGGELALDESIAIAKTLVQIEEKTNPSSVSGDVQVAVILPSGVAREIAPNKAALGRRMHTPAQRKRN